LPLPEAEGMSWLRLPATSDSIEKFRAFILDQAGRAGLSEERFPVLELALEELLVNVVSYAYDGKPGWIRVGCGTGRQSFQVWIEDQGKSFNPLTRAEPELNASVEERSIGGLGIHLVKTLSDGISYRRLGDCNLLEVRFSL